MSFDFEDMVSDQLRSLWREQELSCRAFVRANRTHRLNVYRVDHGVRFLGSDFWGNGCFWFSWSFALYKPSGWVAPLP